MDPPTDPPTDPHDEWQDVTQVELALPTHHAPLNSSLLASAPPVLPRETPLITPNRWVDHFRSSMTDPPNVDDLLLTRRQRTLSRLMPCMKTSPSPMYKSHLQVAVHMAQSKRQAAFNNDDPTHFQTLQTIYKQLTGDLVDCPRFGSHWEEIGFQGNDPATDLRGVGCLGLLQPLAMLMNPEMYALIRKIHALSRDERQDFPFMVLSINITRIAFDALRKQTIKKYILRDVDQFFDRFNYYFASLLFHFFHVWRTEQKTIKDSGYVLKDLEQLSLKKSDFLLERLEQHLTTYSKSDIQKAKANMDRRTGIATR
ncbi:ELMO domain-containing protein 3-like isoform X1 [Tigriopus californicus]|uniref:ELMO domain-containing protein 3-like isoform X1 n=1 Tax=Tigriopus californicus TaxID=6832 RepID=UPI0027D9FB1E|nr:ELMO domain-containing protein 3-like isoform X1 [Tigriopus californicus]